MRNLLWPVGAMLSVACSPSNAVEAPTLEQWTAETAKGMNAITPKDVGNGLILNSVAAEGSTLVVALKGVEDWRPHLSDNEAAKVISVSFCTNKNIQAALKRGSSFRIDPVTNGGQPLPHLYLCGSNA